MRRKAGVLCMCAGAVLVIAALSLFLYNRHEARAAAVSVEEILPQVADAISEAGGNSGPYAPEMTVVEIDGHGYIGNLRIPALSLELPVMSEWSYPNLRISPCRYTGSTRTCDLVIAAHNYSQHFGSISSLQIGDKVYFLDMDGAVWTYEVAELDILTPTAVDEMTAGEYDLTLFTCTYGGKSRVTVRCERVRADG